MPKGAVVPKYQTTVFGGGFAERGTVREYNPNIVQGTEKNPTPNTTDPIGEHTDGVKNELWKMRTELNDIDREEYSQNLQKRKAYYYKKDGNTVACGYKNMCPLEIITCSENHKGFYLEIQNDDAYNIWAEIEGILFRSHTFSRWDTLEMLHKNLTYIGKEEFLKMLEDSEKNHGYIKQLHITVLKALGYNDLAGHYAEYMRVIKREIEDERQREKLEEKIKLEEKEKKRQEEFDNQLREAENSILKKDKVKNVRMDNGNSVFLELFKANGIKLPLRTQGWVNDILAEVTFRFDGSITYCYFSRGSDSKVFAGYLRRLEQKILEKHSVRNNQDINV